MAPEVVPHVSSTNSVLYIHPALKLVELGRRGHGYVASRGIKRGELLLEEKPFVWDSGADATRPDLSAGVEWLLRTGAVHELPCPAHDYNTLRERAETVASTNAFRNQSPCADGSYPAMLFRASSRFNHDCYPNAGAYAPGGRAFQSVAEYGPQPLGTFALEEIRRGEEVCISYLPDAEQLSPARSRQASLQGWGFTCDCRRCQGGRPLDKRLEGVSAEAEDDGSLERQRLLRDANRDFRSLFDPTSEHYDPPKDDFEQTVARLNRFREDHRFLDRAHCAMQRVRRELIAALQLDAPDGPIARRCAKAAAALLVEELLVLNELLPNLSPCKVRPYAQLLAALKHMPPGEAAWLERDVRVDGCDLWARNALWLHDPREAVRLGAAESRNLPPRPPPGPPPRSGPVPAPGACCSPAPGAGQQRCTAPAARCAGRRWPGCRPARRCATAREAEAAAAAPGLAAAGPAAADEGPAASEDRGPLGLWEAYGEYGGPSAAARGIRGVGAGAKHQKGEGGGSWFKFRK